MSIVTRISTFCITAVFIYLVNLYLRLTVAELFTEELFYFTKFTSDTELDVYNASIKSAKAVKQKRIPREYQHEVCTPMNGIIGTAEILNTLDISQE